MRPQGGVKRQVMAKSEPLSLSLPNLEELPGTALVSVGSAR